jgi:hypothetical protein
MDHVFSAPNTRNKITEFRTKHSLGIGDFTSSKGTS